MTGLILAALAVALVVLAERRRLPRGPTKRAWSGYTPAVLYTRGGEPRWGVVGTWQRGPAWRQAKRRVKALERRRSVR